MTDVCINGGEFNANCVSTTKVTKNHRLFPRLRQLHEFYVKQYGYEPNFFVRVPGR